jgi:hypothetical protein
LRYLGRDATSPDQLKWAAVPGEQSTGESTVTRLAAEAVESSQQPRRQRRLAWAGSPQALTMYVYVLLAFFVTIQLWVDPASRYQNGDLSDVDQANWFMRYSATAIQHFRLPALISTAMNAPHGVNMMWNTSLLLPGIVLAPVTLLAGTQVALTVLLVISFAGSAAAMFYVLRRWRASILAAALGGFLYGFSPALINTGDGHYSLVVAILPPLMLDRLLRMVTRQGSPVRNGVWLGLMAAAELFISEEALVDAAIAAVIMLVVLALSRPREVAGRIRPLAIGLGSGVVVALVVGARGLWVQFHGVVAKTAAATVIINYTRGKTNLGTWPYAFITPANTVLLHTSGTAYSVANYPEPTPEYLAYLGIPLIIVLLVAIIYYWRNLYIRVAGLTCIVLEWLGLGAKPMLPGSHTLPSFLLPWQFVQHLPVISGMVPDRLCILADAGAAAVLAFALDLSRSEGSWFTRNFRNGARVAAGVAVVALLPLFPAPYGVSHAVPLPAGWYRTFHSLRLTSSDRVLLVPFPWGSEAQVMRWQADSGLPQTMIGGMFIAPNEPGQEARAGRAGYTDTAKYLNKLYGEPGQKVSRPSPARLRADMASMKPNAVVAKTSLTTPLGRYLEQLFGRPTVHYGVLYGWKLKPGQPIG